MNRRSFFGKLVPLAAVASVPISINKVEAAAVTLKAKTRYIIKCDPHIVSRYGFNVLNEWCAKHHIDALVVWLPSEGVEIFEFGKDGDSQ